MHVLQHSGQSLQAHAGINAWLRQTRHVASSLPIELHEHVIPDFDVAITVLLGRSGRAAGDIGAVVIENFGAGATGPDVGHLPEVVGGVARAFVVANAHDALGRQADDFCPDVVGFVVFEIHRRPELVFR